MTIVVDRLLTVTSISSSQFVIEVNLFENKREHAHSPIRSSSISKYCSLRLALKKADVRLEKI